MSEICGICQKNEIYKSYRLRVCINTISFGYFIFEDTTKTKEYKTIQTCLDCFSQGCDCCEQGYGYGSIKDKVIWFCPLCSRRIGICCRQMICNGACPICQRNHYLTCTWEHIGTTLMSILPTNITLLILNTLIKR